MDTATAFMMSRAHQGQKHKVFDWHKAARRIKEVKPEIAIALLGL